MAMGSRNKAEGAASLLSDLEMSVRIAPEDITIK